MDYETIRIIQGYAYWFITLLLVILLYTYVYHLYKSQKSGKIDYEKYAKKISEMFIYDFYSLEDKIAKNDIGGISFIHKTALPNFLENAESTYYKYVESNIYGNRKQSLPMVDKITLGEIDRVEYAYGEDKTDEEAYVIKVTWNYTKDEFSDYQKEATLTLVKEDKILYIVELK